MSDLCGTVGPDDVSRRVEVEYNSFDLGVLYRLSEKTKIGLMIKNVYGFSFVEKYNAFSLPRYVTLGISSKRGGTTFALDCETIFGNFGGISKREAKFLVIRTGLEKEIWNYYRVRFGLIFPLVAQLSTSGDLRKDMPWPKMGGAIGAGAEFGRFSVDLAAYGDPAKTYVEQEPEFAATGTVTLKF